MSKEDQVREQSPNVSTEFPVVVLGDERGAAAPGRRLLQGRVAERSVLYPIYLLVSIAGALAAQFALDSEEWSVVPIALGWSTLFAWYWFYGVAYRYRRRLLKYTSVSAILILSIFLAILCVDRAAAQVVIAGGELVERSARPILVWSAIVTLGAAGLLIFHVAFLGRGYRVKKEDGTPETSPDSE